jgi:hypothetical protein
VVSLLARVMYLTQQVQSHGSNFDNEHLNSLTAEELNERLDTLQRFFNSDDPDHSDVAQDVHRYIMAADTQKYLLRYVLREFNWIIVSIMSASYISSLVLMRSLFELLINVATRKTGNMKDRVDSISFLHKDERKEILKLWRRLCAWSHPHGRWIKEVCPFLQQHTPFFHKRLCELCLDELCCLVDIYAVTALCKYGISIDPSSQPLRDPNATLNGLGMLKKRIALKT